jgi:heme-degrading monooxygenase HmoA
MLVKIFIRRHIKAGKDKEVFALLKKLRFNAMSHAGYISGETLISTEEPQEIMVISTWHSMEKWSSWKESEGRKALDAQLEELQEEPTEYEPYVFSKYRLSVQTGFQDPDVPD